MQLSEMSIFEGKKIPGVRKPLSQRRFANPFKNIHILKPRSLSKKTLFKVSRFAIAFVPIIYIFSKINFGTMGHAAMSVAWWTMPLLGTAILAGMFLQGLRWWALMRPFAPMLSLSKALSAHFVGLYYSLMLPSSAAQNVVRAIVLSKDEDYSVSWGSSWIAGVLGLLTLAFLSMYGLLGIERNTLPHGFFQSIVSAFAALFILVALSFSKRFTGPFRRLFGKIFPKRVVGAVENIREAVYQYRGKGLTLVLVFFLTLFMQIVITVGGCLAIYGITGRFLIFECFLYLPVIEILCIALPLAPNGIGVREALLALMFKQIGLTTEQLGIYIILGYFSILLKLVGGIPLLFRTGPVSNGISPRE
jgi:uncharacterized membrane protein YbhN (UPF0104 family)